MQEVLGRLFLAARAHGTPDRQERLRALLFPMGPCMQVSAGTKRPPCFLPVCPCYIATAWRTLATIISCTGSSWGRPLGTPRKARKCLLPLRRQAPLLLMMLCTLTTASCSILLHITSRSRACLVGSGTTLNQHLAYRALSSSTSASLERKNTGSLSVSQAPAMEDSESEV